MTLLRAYDSALQILSDFLSTYLGHVCTRSTNAIGILVFVVNLRIFQTQLVG